MALENKNEQPKIRRWPWECMKQSLPDIHPEEQDPWSENICCDICSQNRGRHLLKSVIDAVVINWLAG